VAVIGDSFTFGQGIEAEDRFSNRLERSLAGSRVEFLNFGRPGDETVDELETLAQVVLPIRPDFVLLQWYVNDVEGRDHSQRPQPAPLLSHWSASLLREHSVLYFLLEQRWQFLQVRMRLSESYEHYMQRRFADPAGPQMQAYARTFREFVATCRDAGVVLGIVLFPDPTAVLSHAYDDLHRQLLALCAEEGASCLDLLPAFEPAARRGVQLQVGPLESHPSAAANEVAAAAILGHFGRQWPRR
jgi:hypothetical protein